MGCEIPLPRIDDDRLLALKEKYESQPQSVPGSCGLTDQSMKIAITEV